MKRIIGVIIYFIIKLLSIVDKFIDWSVDAYIEVKDKYER